jgi:hypothetical protein
MKYRKRESVPKNIKKVIPYEFNRFFPMKEN